MCLLIFQMNTILTVVNGATAFRTTYLVKKDPDSPKGRLKMAPVGNVGTTMTVPHGPLLAAPWVIVGVAPKNGTGTEVLGPPLTPNPADHNLIG